MIEQAMPLDEKLTDPRDISSDSLLSSIFYNKHGSAVRSTVRSR